LWSLPWIGTTAGVLIYGLMAAILFMTDLKAPKQYESECEDSIFFVEGWKAATVKSVMVLPMFFARGFIVWLALAGLVAYVTLQVATYKPQQVRPE